MPRPAGRHRAAAGSASGPAFSPRPGREMEAPPEPEAAGAGPGPGPGEARRDPRVRCCSRRGLAAVLELCAPFVRALAQGQPGGAAAEADAIWVSSGERERERPEPAQGPAGPAGSARQPG